MFCQIAGKRAPQVQKVFELFQIPETRTQNKREQKTGAQLKKVVHRFFC